MKKQFDHRFLLHAFRLRHVKRFAICQCLMPDTVANHSWFTAVLAKYICTEMGYPFDFTNVVVSCALLHDFTESITSDIPYFIKNHSDISLGMDNVERAISTKATDSHEFQCCLNDAIRPQNKMVKRILEICDLLDGVIYLEHERILGNNHQWVRGVRQSMEELIHGKLQVCYNKDDLGWLINGILKDVSNWASFRHDSGVGKSYDKLAKEAMVPQSNGRKNPGNSAINSRHTKGRAGGAKKRRIKKS